MEVSIPRKLYDEWEPTINIKIKYHECYALCDLGASVSTIPKTLCVVLDFREFVDCFLNLHLTDSTIKKTRERINDVLIVANWNYVPVDFIVLDIDVAARPENGQVSVYLYHPKIMLEHTVHQ